MQKMLFKSAYPCKFVKRDGVDMLCCEEAEEKLDEVYVVFLAESEAVQDDVFVQVQSPGHSSYNEKKLPFYWKTKIGTYFVSFKNYQVMIY